MSSLAASQSAFPRSCSSKAVRRGKMQSERKQQIGQDVAAVAWIASEGGCLDRH
jgi:hypothetical protein